jgi:hypothetical protein
VIELVIGDITEQEVEPARFVFRDRATLEHHEAALDR